MVTNVDVTITFTTTLNPIPMMSEESGLPNVNLIFENNFNKHNLPFVNEYGLTVSTKDISINDASFNNVFIVNDLCGGDASFNNLYVNQDMSAQDVSVNRLYVNKDMSAQDVSVNKLYVNQDMSAQDVSKVIDCM